MAKYERKGDQMTIQENNSAPHNDIYIIRLNTNENVLLVLTPHADGGLVQDLESVSRPQRMKTGGGEDGVSVQITYAEPTVKNAKPIMSYHY